LPKAQLEAMDTSAPAAETVLKVECEGDLRRALLKGTPNYTAFDRAVQEIWPNRSAHEAKYMDEDGDACTLTELTFTDFLETAKTTANGQVLRLTLCPATAGESSKAPTAEESFSAPWQHVEQGSDVGDEGLHTVADLTDMQDEEIVQPERSESAAEESTPAAPQAANEGVANSGSEEKSRVVEDRGAPSDVAEQTPQREPSSADMPPASAGYPAPQVRACEEASQAPAESLAEANQRFEEQTDIVMAAFDEDIDGYLSFKEMIALVRFSCDDSLPRDVYEQLCADVGADARQGLSRDALLCIYSCGTSFMLLERDFEAACRKLEGGRPKPRSKQALVNTPMSLVLKNPLLAAPFALDVAERVRQGVVGR
jgi:hypothetical protein